MAALLFAFGVQAAFASPILDELLGSGPQVKLDYGTFKGLSSLDGVDSYLGVPFGKAGRFENPRVVGAEDKLEGIQDATKYGLSCPQQQLVASPVNGDNAEIGGLLAGLEQLAFSAVPVENQGEECLTINVQLPAGINSTEGLPVLFWIHGGGFEFGSSAALGAETTALQGVIYQGARIVKHSMEMGQPIIFASANHRLNAFGTLASQEITDAGIPNLILKDQRTAMQWIQKYISQFGGDPSRVTLFGESAGSLSIATHLVLNDGDTEGLFSGAIMASGAIMKLKDYHHGQDVFDSIAENSGCGSASDKIDCLRKVDYNSLYNAVQKLPTFLSYESTKVPWYPRPDGKYLVDSPHRLLHEGKVAKVPYIVSDMRDEGTLFSLITALNVTTDEGFQKFFHDVFFPSLSSEEVKAFTDQYSADPAEGSPYGTGILNQLGPQYKRISAAIGDYTFQAGRRDLLEHTHSQQKAYTCIIDQSIPLLGQVGALSGLTGLPLLGSFHASDVILNSFGFLPAAVSKNSRDIMSTYVSFVNSQDPNNHGLEDLPYWPTWDPEGKAMFNYREDGARIIKDDFREKQMRFINDNGDTYRC